MKLYKKFSNLFDVNKIKQLSNNDILISSSNTLKIYSINTFENLYKLKEIKTPSISIIDIKEIDFSNQNEILLSISLTNFSIQIIKLFFKNKNKLNNSNLKKSYKHKLQQEINFRLKTNIINLCIESILGILIISINNKVSYYQNLKKEKINFIKAEEYELKKEISIKGMTSYKNKQDNFIITIEENEIYLNNITNISFDIKIYFFEKFELITCIKDINIFPEKGLMSFMTYYSLNKSFLLIADTHEKLMMLKMRDDFDIYEEISLIKNIKELSFNKCNNKENYKIKSICGLHDGTFVVCLYYNESLNEKNYLIRGKINLKTKKFELLEINDNAHNNKINFITDSSMIKGNIKNENFLISGDHEGMLKIWKI